MSERRGALVVNTFAGVTRELAPRTADLVARRRRVFGPGFPLMYGDPVEVARGSGAYLYDAHGRPMLDMYNNVAVLGHSHPAVREAVAAQLARTNTHTRYLDPFVLSYAEELLDTFADGLERLLFTCTGSEANDLALRMARHVTGARGVVVTASAYHGGTAATADCSPSSGPTADWVRVVPAPTAHTPEDWASAVSTAVESLVTSGHGVAALLVDTVFSSDGVHPAPVLAPAAAAVRDAGGLLIADEVQAGFGRLGHGMWGFERHGVQPDLVTLGKPMGNGLPIGAVVGDAGVVDRFGRGVRYFNTFGGSPAAVAAARAVLDTIRGEDLVDHAAAVGDRLLAGLRALPGLGEVRGVGLFVGADVVDGDGRPDPAGAQHVVDGLRAAGVLVSATGYQGATLKIRPPLVVTEDDVALFLDRLGVVLAAG